MGKNSIQWCWVSLALREFLKRGRLALNATRKYRNRSLERQGLGRQVFFSHSGQDYELINLITQNFKTINVIPFFARSWITGKAPLRKVIDALWDSRAVFILLTNNVINNPETREWVSFETGIAKMLTEIEYLSIYGWREYTIELTDLFNRITDFQSFDPYNEQSRLDMVTAMMRIADQL